MKYPLEILELISHFKKLPGIGKRSAERFVFHLLNWKAEEKSRFAKSIEEIDKKILYCNDCGCIIISELCPFCRHSNRDSQMLCIIASPKDVFAMEETKVFKGLYHVLGTLLSPLEEKFPSKEEMEKLKNRLNTLNVKEIILAFDSTLEGDATALFLKQQFESDQIRFTRLALGMPMGSSLDFLDENTLAFAFKGRQII